MPYQIQQTSWYLEEIYLPKPARKIKYIFDLLTNETIQQFVLPEDTVFIDFGAHALNCNNKELAALLPCEQESAIDKVFSICINLGPLDAYPQAKNPFDPNSPMKGNYRHVKLEIGYIEIPSKNKIRIVQDNLIADVIQPKRFAEIEQDGLFQPEFHLVMPKGWQLDGDSIIKPPHCWSLVKKLAGSTHILARPVHVLDQWSKQRTVKLRERLAARFEDKLCERYEGKMAHLFYYFESHPTEKQTLELKRPLVKNKITR